MTVTNGDNYFVVKAQSNLTSSGTIPRFNGFGATSGSIQFSNIGTTNTAYFGTVGVTGAPATANVAVVTTALQVLQAPTKQWQTVVVSDIRTKKDVTAFTDGLNVINQLNPVSWLYNGSGGTMDGQFGVGLIAQDLEKVAPYMVGTMTTLDL